MQRVTLAHIRGVGRLIGVVVLILVVVYASLPWCLPSTWLANVLSERLGTSLNRRVAIPSVTFGFARGLTLEGLSVSRRPGFGDGDFFTAERVTVPLSRHAVLRPAKLLAYLGGWGAPAFEVMRFERPACWIVAAGGDQFNIADLNDRGVTHLPAASFEASEFRVSFVDLRDDAGGADSDQELVLPYLRCASDPRTGRLRWDGGTAGADDAEGEQPEWVQIKGQVNAPRLRQDVFLEGGGSLAWNNLDLSQWPTMLIPWPAVTGLRGRSDGEVRLEVAPDLTVSFQVQVQVTGLTLRMHGGDPWEFAPEARVMAAGRWDPQGRRLEVSEARLEAPGQLHLASDDDHGGPAIFDLQTQQVSFGVAGRVVAWEGLRGVLPRLTRLSEADLRVRGPSSFRVGYTAAAQRGVCRVEVDAATAAVEVPGRARFAAGQAKQLGFTLVREHADWRVHEAELQVAGSRLVFAGDLPLRRVGLQAQRPPPRGSVTFEAQDLGGLVAQLPVLQRAMPGLQAGGALSLTHAFGPRGDALAVEGGVSFDEASFITWQDHVHKTPGRALALNYSGRSPLDAPLTIDSLSVACRYGQASLVSRGTGNALVLSGVSAPSNLKTGWPAQRVLETSLVLAVEARQVDQWFGLFPFAMRDPSGDPHLSGNCSASLALHAARIDHRQVFRADVSINAAGTSVRLPYFRKTAERPCRLAIAYFLDDRLPRRYQRFRGRAELEGGEVRATWERFTDPESAGGRSDWDLEVGVHVRDWSRVLSVAGPVVPAGTRFSGAGEFKLRASRAPDTQHVAARIDLTQTELWQQGTVLKGTGVPLELSLNGKLEPDSTGRRNTLVCDRVVGRAGPLKFAADSLRAILVDDDPIANLSGPLWSRLAAVGRAELNLDRRWTPPDTDLGFAGSVSGAWRLGYEDMQWSVDADMDVTALEVLNAAVVTKGRGVPGRLRVTAELLPGAGGHSVVADIGRLEATSGVLELVSSGSLEFPLVRGRPRWPTDGRVQVEVHARNLRQLLEGWAQRSGLRPGGAVHARATWQHEPGGWRLLAADLKADDLHVATNALELTADGEARFADGRWECERLALQLGALECLIRGGGFVGEQATPWATVRFGELDAEVLVAELRCAAQELSRYLPRLGTRWNTVEEALAWLLYTDLEATVRAEVLRVANPRYRVDHRLEEVLAQVTLGAGAVRGDFRAAHSGGLLRGACSGDPLAPDCNVSLSNALPTPGLSAALRYAFPGLTAIGSIDYTRRRRDLDTGTDSEDIPVAEGELIVRRGTLHGKAAPDVVTRIFPGLNLASFEFNLMHDWYTTHADGRVHHQAIFQGRRYHLYADGWEDPAGTVVYEIGIDLLAGLDSQYWGTRGAGRIPLFVSTTVLDDSGQVVEESVNYVPRQSIRGVLWDSNPLHTAYLALQKRIREEREE